MCKYFKAICVILAFLAYTNGAKPPHHEEDDATKNYGISYEKSNLITVLIQIIGWMYFASWSISMYPQVFLNANRRSVVGLNFDYVLLNIIGHTSYMIYNLCFYFNKSVQKQYFQLHDSNVNPVLMNDVFFSIHATILTAYTIYQCFIYEKGSQRISRLGLTFALLLLGYLFFSGILYEVFEFINGLEYAYCFSYVKLVVTVLKYMPQAYMNYTRKSTIGWSIENVLLDFSGGVLSVLQMFLLAYNTDDWSSILGSPTKLGLGLISIFYDVIFMIQHYILYPEKELKFKLLTNN